MRCVSTEDDDDNNLFENSNHNRKTDDEPTGPNHSFALLFEPHVTSHSQNVIAGGTRSMLNCPNADGSADGLDSISNYAPLSVGGESGAAVFGGTVSGSNAGGSSPVRLSLNLFGKVDNHKKSSLSTLDGSTKILLKEMQSKMHQHLGNKVAQVPFVFRVFSFFVAYTQSRIQFHV